MKQAGKFKRVSTPRLPKKKPVKKRRVMAYTVKDLKLDIATLPDDEEIVIVFEMDPDLDDDMEEMEDGDLLDIQEVGGYMRGMRLIRARPR